MNISATLGGDGEHAVDPNHQHFPKELRYKREASCDTNGKHTVIHMRGLVSINLSSGPTYLEKALHCELEVNCNAFGIRTDGGAF